MASFRKFMTGKELRGEVRTARFQGQTAGQAPGHLQGNIVILPLRYAADFLLFCTNNPKPCPLVGISSVGGTSVPSLGDFDIRSDIPRYRVFREGRLDAEVTDIADQWRDDLVTFVLGCSFTFEEALMRSGFQVRHIEFGRNVAMFRTSIMTMPGGIFSGPLVVTMRSYPEEQIAEVFDLSSRYPHAHGTPVYWGDPASIGIEDIMQPAYGDAITVPEDETPVFWACGVTPQAAIETAKPDFCITHAPGCMLVTDVSSDEPPAVTLSMAALRQISHS